MEIDEAILCPPDGLVLIGWFLSKPGHVEAIRLRSGGLSTPMRIEDCIRIDRPDVLESVGSAMVFPIYDQAS